MASTQPQWAIDYLAAFMAANGQTARLVPVSDRFQVVAQDGSSTGFAYTEGEIVQRTKRLRERATRAAA